jgi:hypothetical protein
MYVLLPREVHINLGIQSLYWGFSHLGMQCLFDLPEPSSKQFFTENDIIDINYKITCTKTHKAENFKSLEFISL